MGGLGAGVQQTAPLMEGSIQSLDGHDIGLVACRMSAHCWVPNRADDDPSWRGNALASVDDSANGLVAQLLNGQDIVGDGGRVSADRGIPGIVDFYPARRYRTRANILSAQDCS